MKKDEFVKKTNEIHGDKYDYSLVSDNIKYKQYVNIICSEHGVFEQSIETHLKGSGCKKCTYFNKYMTQEKFIMKASKIHNNKYTYFDDFIDINTEIKIECPKHGIYLQKPKNHLLHGGCKKCNIDKYKKCFTKDESVFLIQAKTIFNEYDYSLVKYINQSASVEIICSVHGVFKQTPKSLLSGHGCKKCYYDFLSNNMTKDKEYCVEKFNKIHNNKYDYSLMKYINAKSDIIIICPIHGKFLQKSYVHMNGFGCKKCSESIGEKKVRTYLINNNILFESQKTFDGCVYKQKLKFDFYLTDYNKCIEFDGEQHYVINEYFGGEKAFKNRQIKDKIKDEYCKNNNIHLLRIKFDENIEEKMNQFIFSL